MDLQFGEIPTSVSMQGGHWKCCICTKLENGEFGKLIIDPAGFQRDTFSCGYWTIALIIRELSNRGIEFPNITSQIMTCLNGQRFGLNAFSDLRNLCLQHLLEHAGVGQEQWPEFLRVPRLSLITQHLAASLSAAFNYSRLQSQRDQLPAANPLCVLSK